MLKEEDRTKGLLLNLTGDGTGKSSSAFGIAVRALGWEWRVAVLQFIKGGRPTGERNFFRKYVPGMMFESCGLGLTKGPGDHAFAVEAAQQLLRPLPAGCGGGSVVAGPGRRAGLNVIVTGRGAAPELLEIADLVSEIRAVRHPFLNGEPARKGLDY